MHPVMMVSADRPRLADFAAVFETAGFEVVWEESGAAALQRARRIRPLLAVLDEQLVDMTAWEAIRRLLAVDAAINTAVVSRLDPDKFHAVSEGLGVMARIPFNPEKRSAMEVIEALNRMIRPPIKYDNS